jgi:hypothetical protein
MIDAGVADDYGMPDWCGTQFHQSGAVTITDTHSRHGLPTIS